MIPVSGRRRRGVNGAGSQTVHQLPSGRDDNLAKPDEGVVRGESHPRCFNASTKITPFLSHTDTHTFPPHKHHIRMPTCTQLHWYAIRLMSKDHRTTAGLVVRRTRQGPTYKDKERSEENDMSAITTWKSPVEKITGTDVGAKFY